MDTVYLFNGAEDFRYGSAILRAVSQVSRHRDIKLFPEPIKGDLLSYTLVKEALERAQRREKQVNVGSLLETVIGRAFEGKRTLTLTDSDLYADGLNWCFGFQRPDSRGGSHVVLSTYRLKDTETLTHVATHELGHMFGAAKNGRPDTEESLGNHCTNLCVMQQGLSIQEMKELARKLRRKENKFCYRCGEDIREE